MGIIDKLRNKDERSRNTMKGMAFMVSSTGIDAVCRLLLVMILARIYSKDEFGIWATITSTAAIVATGDLGITNALRNKVSLLLVQDKGDSSNSQRYFYSAFYLFLSFAVLASLVLLACKSYIPFDLLFKTDNQKLQEAGVDILIGVQLIFLFTIPLTIGCALFFSYQESHYSAKVTALQAILTLIIIVILALLDSSIILISIVYFLISMVISFGGTLFFVYRHKWFNFCISKKDFYLCNKELLLTGIKFMTLQLSSSFLQNAGTIAASAMLGIRSAAEFNMVTKLYTFAVSVIQSIFNPLWGAYADAYYKGEFDWCKKAYIQSARLIVLLFGLFTLATMGLGNLGLAILAGPQYTSTTWMFTLLGMNTLLYMLFNSATLLPKSSGRINLLLIVSLSATLLVTPLMRLMVKEIDILGLPVASLIIWILLFGVMHWKSFSLIKTKA